MEYPRQMSLGTLQAGAFRVVTPIPVVIDRFDCWYTATWAEVSEYGVGATPSEARNDLCRSIAASCFQFANAVLGPGLQQDWDKMKQHIIRVEPGGEKPSDRDEAREQAISDLVEKIANLPGITPADLELLEEITKP